MIDDLGCVTVVTMYLFTCYSDKYLANNVSAFISLETKTFYFDHIFNHGKIVYNYFKILY